jgi:sugar/nucleoside kinase (ribokinase family)
VWFEPTSVPKAKAVAKANILKKFTYISPNIKELVAIVRELDPKFTNPEPTGNYPNYMQILKYRQGIKEYLQFVEALLKKVRIPNIILKLGAEGVLLVSMTPFDSSTGAIPVNGNRHHFAHYKAPAVNKIVSVTGNKIWRVFLANFEKELEILLLEEHLLVWWNVGRLMFVSILD